MGNLAAERQISSGRNSGWAANHAAAGQLLDPGEPGSALKPARDHGKNDATATTIHNQSFHEPDPQKSPPALVDRQGACVGSSTTTISALPSKPPQLAETRHWLPLHHSHRSASCGLTHSPFLASLALFPHPSGTVSPDAYFQSHLRASLIKTRVPRQVLRIR